jgi:hypothetical protein
VVIPAVSPSKKHLTSWSSNDKIITSVEELINKNSGVAIE